MSHKKSVFWSGLKDMFSEPGGTLSWGRAASTACLLASIAWVTYSLRHNGQIPSLDGVTGFTIGPYAANKVTAAAQSFANRTNQQ